jgi:hypothetical protein
VDPGTDAALRALAHALKYLGPQSLEWCPTAVLKLLMAELLGAGAAISDELDRREGLGCG